MHSQQFEDLRRQARHLENELEMKLISYNKLCSAFTASQFSDSSPLLGKAVSDPTADTMTIEIEQLLNKLTSLNDRMADFSQQMSSTPTSSSASSQSSLFHVVQRHRDIMQDYSREFSKTRSNLQSAKDRADLLGSTRVTNSNNGPGGSTSLSNRRAELYNKELGHILNTDRLVDEQIELVMSTKDHLISQRGRIQTVGQRLHAITSKYPMLNSLMQRINFRKRRDAIIIAVVVAVCIFLILIYAVR